MLERIYRAQEGSITSHLKSISHRQGIPLSTLKLNAMVLRKLELISVTDHTTSLTQSGNEACQLLRLNFEQVLPIQEVN